MVEHVQGDPVEDHEDLLVARGVADGRARHESVEARRLAARLTRIGLEVEAETGGGDHLQVEVVEIDGGGGANAVEATADDVQGVLGGVEQEAPGLGDGGERIGLHGI